MRSDGRAGDWALDHGPLAVMGLPFVVATVVALTSDWHPSGDVALEALAMGDVGGPHTPLLGVYSRYGWRHPGPLLLWIGAPFQQAIGPQGMLGATGLVNLASVLVAGAAARRVGGRMVAWLLAGCVLAALWSAGPSHLVYPWNPYAAMLPLLAFLMAAAAAATGVRWALPAAVAAGSFAVQSHLGSGPVVAVATIGAGVWAWREHRSPSEGGPGAESGRVSGRWWLAGTVALLLLLWSGPLVDQAVNDPGNLRAIVSFTVTGGDEPAAPLGETMEVAARELGLPPAWIGGDENVDEVPLVRPGAPWTLGAVALILLGASGAAWRWGDRRALRLVVWASAVWLAAVVASTRLVGLLIDYLVRWTWPVAILAALSVATVLGRALSASPRVAATPPLLKRIGGLAGVVVLLVASGVLAGRATTTEVLPLRHQSDSIRGLSAAVRNALPRGPYAYRWLDAYDLNSTTTGLGVDLVRHGYDLEFPEREAFVVGGFRAGDGDGRDEIVVIGQRYGAGLIPDEGELVTTFDSLTRDERRRLDEAERQVRADVSPPIAGSLVVESAATIDDLQARGARRRDLEVIRDLQRLGEAYEVFLVPAV